MAGRAVRPARSVAVAVGLWMVFTSNGCSRVGATSEKTAQNQPPLAGAPSAELQASSPQAAPRQLTDLPVLPRREAPHPRIGNARIPKTEPADDRTQPTPAPPNPATNRPNGRLAEAGPNAGNPLRDPASAGAAPNARPFSNAPATQAPPSVPAPAVKPSPAATSPISGSSPTTTAADQKPATQRPRHVPRSAAPFDPIKADGPIFVGRDGVEWPKPRFAFVLTGMEEGYIEPCGCAGLDRMKGGMTRRYTFIEKLRKEGWPVVALDVGGIARGYGQEALLKFLTMIEGKREMGYQAIALGTSDLQLPAGELAAAGGSVPDPRTVKPQPSLFISANVALFDSNSGIIDPVRIIEAGGMRIGVTAILGKQYQQAVHNSEVKMSDPEEALRRVVPELRRRANCLVLLAHATRDETLALVKAFPEFNVVVTAEGYSVPPDGPYTIPGTNHSLLIQVGHEGMYAVVLGLFDAPVRHWLYQRVPLDSRFPAASKMKLLMSGYQEQLKALGFAGLGLRGVPHPLKATNGQFVGSKQCESCHDVSYEIWKHSGHGHAYETLVKLQPPRNFDPECVSCHVTGWNPGKFFPYESGYQSEKKTPALVNTGCEDCHGPGEKHVAVELAGTAVERQRLRKAMRVTKAEAEKQLCITCHDGENSPDFDFKTYWPLIEHKEQ